MPFSAMQQYLRTLETRKAETRLMLGEAASVPHMDEEKHSAWAQSLKEYFESEPKAKLVSPQKLMKIGIKVRTQ